MHGTTIEHITEADVTEGGHYTFVASASELRWPVGHVPHALTTTLGNQQGLRLTRVSDQKVEYQQVAGVVRVVVYFD